MKLQTVITQQPTDEFFLFQLCRVDHTLIRLLKNYCTWSFYFHILMILPLTTTPFSRILCTQAYQQPPNNFLIFQRRCIDRILISGGTYWIFYWSYFGLEFIHRRSCQKSKKTGTWRSYSTGAPSLTSNLPIMILTRRMDNWYSN